MTGHDETPTTPTAFKRGVTKGDKMRAIPELSEESKRLAKILQDIPPGGFVEYDALSLAVGLDVRTEGRSRLGTARNICMREYAMVFAAVRGKGLKRLVDREIASIGTASLQKINRACRRDVRAMSCVSNYDALTDAEKARYNMSSSMMAMVFEATKTRRQDQVEAVVAVSPRKLPYQDTLRAIRGE